MHSDYYIKKIAMWINTNKQFIYSK